MCEPKTLPAPTANTINSGEAPPSNRSGETMPAAVRPATVAEPKDIRNKAVMTHANKYGFIFQRLLKEVM